MNIVVLAGGLGKRMGEPALPKVLTPLHGRPIISYILEAIIESGIDPHPTIVVCKRPDLIMDMLGDSWRYVNQREALGTGHAVLSTREVLEPVAKDVLVLNGDHPMVSAKMIKNLATTHETNGNVLTLGTVTVPDFNGWRAGFYEYGRVIRDDHGKLIKIVEKKDANETELEIKELNPQYVCYRAEWMWSALEKIQPNNAQGEYYLTDLLQMAVEQKVKIGTIAIDPKEALGVNTKEQLALVESLL